MNNETYRMLYEKYSRQLEETEGKMVVLRSKIEGLMEELGITPDGDLEKMKSDLEAKKDAFETELNRKVDELESLRNGM